MVMATCCWKALPMHVTVSSYGTPHDDLQYMPACGVAGQGGALVFSNYLGCLLMLPISLLPIPSCAFWNIQGHEICTVSHIWNEDGLAPGTAIRDLLTDRALRNKADSFPPKPVVTFLVTRISHSEIKQRRLRDSEWHGKMTVLFPGLYAKPSSM